MKTLQILTRANPSEEEMVASHVFIHMTLADAKKYLAWYELARNLRVGQEQFRALEFFPDFVELFDEIPPALEEHEDAIFENRYLVLPQDAGAYDPNTEEDGWLDEHQLSLDYTTLHVEVAHLDMPSFCGFRWEAGIKHCRDRVESELVPASVLQEFVESANRCPHEMFYSGAGACPQCGRGAE